MAETGQDHVLQLVDLVLDALVDTRVGVAKHVDPPAAHCIEVALAFEVFQPHAFAAPDRDQRQLLVVFHLGTGVPQYLEVALHPLIIEAHGHFSWLCGLVRPRKPKQCGRAGQPPLFIGLPATLATAWKRCRQKCQWRKGLDVTALAGSVDLTYS
ncbi:hypothetical protein PPS11_14036 [Pseudomonas putida S11]|nr:hypothetical protein PPS11_14036 [Pseudomonas putida S11]